MSSFAYFIFWLFSLGHQSSKDANGIHAQIAKLYKLWIIYTAKSDTILTNHLIYLTLCVIF